MFFPNPQENPLTWSSMHEQVFFSQIVNVVERGEGGRLAKKKKGIFYKKSFGSKNWEGGFFFFSIRLMGPPGGGGGGGTV